jgi:hypothetical protein
MIMSLAEYTIVDGEMKIKTRKEIIPDPEGFDPGGKHKNWSPFMYEGNLHFVQQINPLVVVNIAEYMENNTQSILNRDEYFHAKTVSIADPVVIEGNKHGMQTYTPYYITHTHSTHIHSYTHTHTHIHTYTHTHINT